MEITSASSDGPEPDQALFAGLIRSNAAGDLDGAPPPRHAAGRFRAVGWSVRDAGYEEYQVRCTWAKLVLFALGGAQGPTLHTMFSGFLSPRHAPDLAAVLDGFGWEYSFEVWDPATDTTSEFQSGN